MDISRQPETRQIKKRKPDRYRDRQGANGQKDRYIGRMNRQTEPRRGHSTHAGIRPDETVTEAEQPEKEERSKAARAERAAKEEGIRRRQRDKKDK